METVPTLPANFHERVVELEMNIEGREFSEDEGALVAMISELMGLYSVNNLNFLILLFHLGSDRIL